MLIELKTLDSYMEKMGTSKRIHNIKMDEKYMKRKVLADGVSTTHLYSVSTGTLR